MQNSNIARVLKFHRKLNHYSVREVSEQLTQGGYPAAEKTVYGWESGQAQPSADILMYLCKMYRISDILGEFGYQQKWSAEAETSVQMEVSPLEEELIRQFRAHEDMQSAVMRLLEMKTE